MQNYSNHRRLFPLHHFVIAPLTLALFIYSIVNFTNQNDSFIEKCYFLVSAFTLLLIALIARMYATKNQDRIIRIEMRLRYFELTGKSFKTLENQLVLSQIIALRFAGDDELLPLIENAISNKLSSKEIKLAIKDWQADLNRV